MLVMVALRLVVVEKVDVLLLSLILFLTQFYFQASPLIFFSLSLVWRPLLVDSLPLVCFVVEPGLLLLLHGALLGGEM